MSTPHDGSKMKNTIEYKNAEKISDLTFTLVVLCQEKEQRMSEEFGISQSEFRTIRLFRGEQHISQKILNKRLGLSGSRLTRILDQLQERGFITRREDAGDRREFVIPLTPHGLDLAARLEERHIGIHAEILEAIPGELHAGLGDGMEKMVIAVRDWLMKRESKETMK